MNAEYVDFLDVGRVFFFHSFVRSIICSLTYFSHSLICLIHVTAYFQAARAFFHSSTVPISICIALAISDSFIDSRMPFLIAHLPKR